MSHRPPPARALLLAPLLALLGLGCPARALAEDPATPPPGTPGTKALDERFAGTVVGLKGKVVSIRYDFGKQEQMRDWEEGVPFPVARAQDQGIRWFDEKIEIKGSTGARHKAEWVGDISVSCTLVPDTDRDLGAYLAPAAGTDDYATFTLGETYFHKWDGKAGGVHSILKFGKQFRESGSSSDYTGFRYVDERPPNTPLTPGRPVPATFGLAGGKLTFVLPDYEIKGGDRGVKLKTFWPGFYVINGRVLVDDVVITGRLSDAWLAKEKVELRTLRPIVEPAAGDVDPDTRALVEAYAASGKDAAPLVKVVGDPGKPAASRAAAARALAAGPKRAVRPALDLLYSPDLEARSHGIGIVKGLLGKDFGFNPKASEEQRSGAIQRLNKELAENPGLLDG